MEPLEEECQMFVLRCFPSSPRPADLSLSAPPHPVLPYEGVCDSGPVKSHLWDAQGGVLPYLPAPPAPAARSGGPRLLSPRLLPLSVCGGLSSPPIFSFFLLQVCLFLFEQQTLKCCLSLFKVVKPKVKSRLHQHD